MHKNDPSSIKNLILDLEAYSKNRWQQIDNQIEQVQRCVILKVVLYVSILFVIGLIFFFILLVLTLKLVLG